MTAFLIGLADLYKYTQVDLERIMKQYESTISSAQKGKENAKSQFVMLKSEKTAMKKSLDEAKATRDEALAVTDSLRFEYERKIRVVKEEVEEKVTRVMSERDEAMKVLEEGKADLKAIEESIKK